MNRSDGLGFEFGTMLSEMSKNVTASLVKKLPDIAVNTLASVAVSKLSSKLAGDSDSGSAAKPKAKTPAKTPAVPARAGLRPPAAQPGLPGWVVPVAAGVGALALGVVALRWARARGRK